MSLRNLQRIASLGLVLLLAACASQQPAPVTERVAMPASPAPAVAVVPPVAEPTVPPPPPREVDPRPEHYVVKRGDTLYSIALEHGLDYRELAGMNNIDNANLIRVGQVLRVRPAAAPAAVSEAPVNGTASTAVAMAAVTPIGQPRPLDAPAGSTAGVLKSQPKAVKLPYGDQALAQVARASVSAFAPDARPESRPESRPEPRPETKPELAKSEPAKTESAKSEAKPEPKPAAPSVVAKLPAAPVVPPAVAAPAAPVAPIAPAAEEDKVDWIWPTQGKVVAPFNENANLKGLDIGGKLGQPVLASAAGRVVYAGGGLRGYGKLIIIKHNKTYLSAYAHNKEILIKEGDSVSKGQKIAELGNTDTDQPKLHFEIRRFGKPVDPARYLPASPAA
ncbi:Murein hydrolase activator NlpD [Burkholderiales bacterium]|nr:MAG: peptidoglycan DD-metalloendopeptidase family protein [Burkholderiales bacterium]CAG1005792.1 Murein hydrolase activator NlpD [Burkholderiales bacterium]